MHLKNEQVTGNSHCGTLNRMNRLYGLHLVVRQKLHALLVASLELPTEAVIRVVFNLSKQHGAVQDSL